MRVPKRAFSALAFRKPLFSVVFECWSLFAGVWVCGCAARFRATKLQKRV
jgi:hypothetical protein